MKRIALALFLLALLCPAAAAQPEAARPAPTPFDSFGDKVYETD